jgi:hypothetical protein
MKYLSVDGLRRKDSKAGRIVSRKKEIEKYTDEL